MSITTTAKVSVGLSIIYHQKNRCCIAASLFCLICGVKLLPHHPSSAICGHVTINLNGLAFLSSYIDGVQARGGLPIQQNLSTVPGASVQLSNCISTCQKDIKDTSTLSSLLLAKGIHLTIFRVMTGNGFWKESKGGFNKQIFHLSSLGKRKNRHTL